MDEFSADEEERQPSQPARPVVDEYDNYILSDDDLRSQSGGSKPTVRALSEEIADSMEV